MVRAVLTPETRSNIALFSLAHEPKDRLASQQEAEQWISGIITDFFAAYSLQLPSQHRGGTGGVSPAAQISSVQLEGIERRWQDVFQKQIGALQSFLDNDHRLAKVGAMETQGLELLQDELRLWTAEYGPEMAEMLKPKFSPAKVRQYDSWWNWARQSLFQLTSEGRPIPEHLKLLLMNQSTLELCNLLEFSLARAGSVSKELLEFCETLRQSTAKPPTYRELSTPSQPLVQVASNGKILYSEVPRSGTSSCMEYVQQMHAAQPHSGKPWLHIKIDSTACKSSTRTYLEGLDEMARQGISFAGKTALVTGCGRDSIGYEIVKRLLSGGAQVVATTSSYSASTAKLYRRLYCKHGARDAKLVVAPFNQGSVQDIAGLVAFIYEAKKGLGWDLDFVFPFAAVAEKGRELGEIDAKSEFAHRVMLTHVHRLIGAIAQAKRDRGIETRPALAVLPLSPNHGNFGGDGLYGESKIALETLLNRWRSESWGDYVSVVGASIGWTRGTGLMSDNNLLAADIEREGGARTFSREEMAFNILGLLHPRMVKISERAPLYADLNGGLDAVSNLSQLAATIRSRLSEESERQRTMATDQAREEANAQAGGVQKRPYKRAHQTFEYPAIPDPSKHQQDELLSSLLDPAQVVVLTGFSEVGPWGNSRTRWEMEATGEFSLEGCIEMAWIMGMIKFDSQLPTGSKAAWTGWVDARTGERVEDHQIKARYEEEILRHAGIRLIEPELFDGYDPERKTLCREVILDQDLGPFIASREEAESFKRQHGDKCRIVPPTQGGGEEWRVSLKRGATLFIPKALRFDRLVAGQIPTGWSAARYGVPQDIVEQVDPVTLYALVATAEALVSAGIADPYELYQYIHVSEMGNTAGGGEGGMMSNRKIFKSRFLDQPVQSDILQESFINTMPAWINLLLLSASGPIKTPVGACATAVQSLELGVEAIQSGKAKCVVVGGFDDLQEESSYEFASMRATSNTLEEWEKGREPGEMSRPAASTRAGFMESQGAGIQILMTAELALQMGCPIYAIVALTNTAMDKEGRSIPAPGQGILTTARSVRPTGSARPRILDATYRRAQLATDLAHIKEWLGRELELLRDSQTWVDCGQGRTEAEERNAEQQVVELELEAARRTRAARQLWGLDFWKGDPRIAPLEGALAAYNLDIDDVGLASFHGTGTRANDLNESQVVNGQLEHLGRSRGNVLPCVFQKYLTGHPKGAAAAWMLNG